MFTMNHPCHIWVFVKEPSLKITVNAVTRGHVSIIKLSFTNLNVLTPIQYKIILSLHAKKMIKKYSTIRCQTARSVQVRVLHFMTGFHANVSTVLHVPAKLNCITCAALPAISDSPSARLERTVL